MTGVTGLVGQLVTNPAFAGLAGGVGASAVLYQLRAIPATALARAKSSLTVSIAVDNSDDIFQRLALYLGRSDWVNRARRLRMTEHYDDRAQSWRFTPTFGEGLHLLRDDGRWFLVSRSIEQSKGPGTAPGVGRRIETLTLTTLGRSQAAVRRLLERAEAVHQLQETVRVHVWMGGGYMLADQKPRRSLDTVFMPDAQKLTIVDDLQRFLSARDLYRARGTPYRRGYLFSGPPGTGKTTLALALASLSSRSLYIINPQTAGGDTGLQQAFAEAGADAIVVMEDLDTASVSHDRATKPAELVQAQNPVTLSGLLNAVDGLSSRDGRVLILTTNHPERLDPALLRPGRVDRHELIGLLGPAEAATMARAYLPEWSADRIDAWCRTRVPIAPANLQEQLLGVCDREASR
jgi:hypothetical protein